MSASKETEAPKSAFGNWVTQLVSRFWIWFVLGLLAAAILMAYFGWDWMGEMSSSGTNIDRLGNVGFIFFPLAALIFAWKRIQVAQRQAEIAHENLSGLEASVKINYETLQHNIEKDRSTLLNNRYNKAIELLTDRDVSARLLGIHELQQIASEEMEQFHVRVMRALCAFVRFPPEDFRIETRNEENYLELALRQDVQTAMEVIGSRDKERIEQELDAEYRLDLRNAILVNLDLKLANLSGAVMNSCVLVGAKLEFANFVEVQLEHAVLSSPQNVSHDDLRLAVDSMARRTMTSHYQSVTAMTCANFSGAWLSNSHVCGAHLHGAIFSGAHSEYADFSNALLRGADLSAVDFLKAKLRGTDLSAANLSSKRNDDTPTDPPQNLRQEQLDRACADPDDPPLLYENSNLVWNGSPC